MPVPEFQCYMVPLLELSATGEIALKDAVQTMASHFDLTEDEREELVTGGTITKNRDRVGWAVTYLVQARLMQRPKRGIFTITGRGKEVLSNHPDRIDKAFLMQFEEFVDFQNRSKKKKPKTTMAEQQVDATDLTPEERIESAHSEISAQLQDELLERALSSSPMFFEKLIVKLLVAMGYGGSMQQAGEHLGRTGDGGIDGVINEDKLGLDLIYIQAKRYAKENTVGRPEIQKFAGSLMGLGAQKGVFVSTSSFSSQAVEYARHLPQRLILIDGELLTELMIEHNVGTRLERSIDLKKIDEDFFE